MAHSARETALSVLAAYRKNGAWSDNVLKDLIKRDALDTRDAALAAQICYGVLQNRALCDFYIEAFSSIKLKRYEPIALDILRIGIYQLHFLDKIPAHAAVFDAVESAKKHSKNAAGIVNAVLRAYIRNKDALPEVPKDDYDAYLSVQYSHPLWLVKQLKEAVGEDEIENLLKENNSQPKTVAQVNTLLTDVDAAKTLLEQEGARADGHPWLEDCLYLSETGNIEQLAAFQNGSILISDAASKLAVLAAAPEKGWQVIDGCAAPGGKSFLTAIQMKNEGNIISGDIHDHKIRLIEKGAKRLGITVITPKLADAKVQIPEYMESADLVIADVPCSGLGIIRKKPDIRYKAEAQLESLPRVQLDIIRNLASYVKPGGILLYVTCTLRHAENEGVIWSFLEERPDFKPEEFNLPEPVGRVSAGMITLFPHIHKTDGFFICRMRKRS